jgi:type III secretory pathway component EscU
MAKKRTRKQKVQASVKAVNSQFVMTFEANNKVEPKLKKTIVTANNAQIASVRNELLKSLTIAVLIVISLVVLYWFS